MVWMFVLQELQMALTQVRRHGVSFGRVTCSSRDFAAAIDTSHMATDAIKYVSSNQQGHICADDW
jgi:hypothetical protein